MKKHLSEEVIRFYVFSDDPDWVKENLLLEHTVVGDWNQGIDSRQDMYLMSVCRHHIIANCYILISKAKEKYGLELNTFLEENEIIGFIPDIKFASFRQEVSPMAFYLPGDSQTQGIDFYNVAYIQLDSNRDIYKNLTFDLHTRSPIKSRS
ncbi:hypothetical protein HCH02_19470 [Parabacteroides merdae]|nr:hypothetical protein [Parabacteroides merdae]